MLLFDFLLRQISIIALLAMLWILLPKRWAAGKSLLLMVPCLAATGVLDYLELFRWNGLAFLLVKTCAEIIAVQLTAIILCRYRDFRAVFSGMTAAALVLPGNMVGTVTRIYTGHSAAALGVQILIHLLILAFLFFVVRLPYQKNMEVATHFWGQMCLIPALCYLVQFSFAVWPSNIEKTPQNALGSVLLMVLLLVTYGALLRFRRIELHSFTVQQDLESLQNHAASLQRMMESEKKAEQAAAILRHDIHHYLNLAMADFSAGDYESVKALLTQMGAKVEETRVRHFCRNTALDSVLNSYAGMAKRQSVSFYCRADVPQELPFDVFSFATVIANLLENALSAASQLASDGYVRFTIQQVKGQLAVSVVNPYRGTCDISPVTGLPVSHGGPGHGYGLRSVQSFVSSIHGDFDYDTAGGLFTVRLLIDLEA